MDFLVDRPGWAFDRNVRNLQSALAALGVQVCLSYQHSMPSAFTRDCVVACWWPDVAAIRQRVAPPQRILCRIADMLTWNQCAPLEYQAKFRAVVPFVDAFLVSSLEIDDALRRAGIGNSIVISDTVDADTFVERQFEADRKPVFGWCGNRDALRWLGFEDVKGQRLLSSLRNREDLVFEEATNRPSHEMPEWYRHIDVYVCASRAEGTPLPILEAMSVGAIVLSTRVGIVPEITSSGVFTFDGTPAGLATAVLELLRRRREWPTLGRENRRYVLGHRTPSIIARKLLSELWPTRTAGAVRPTARSP